MNRALLSAILSFPFAAAACAQMPAAAQPAVALKTLTSAGTPAKFQPVLGAIRIDSVNVPFEVKIEPSALASDSSSIEAGADHWAARGYDLKSVIAELFAMDARLVDVPDDLATNIRYDVSLSAPVELDQDSMQQILIKALNERFGVTIRPETRTMDVYVLTAPDGPASGLKRHVFPRRHGLKRVAGGDEEEAGGRITYMGQNCSGMNSGGITVEGGTIADFRRTLEPDLDRVLVDETGLRGSYDFRIGLYANQRQLFELMHVALGLVVTPEQRTVTVLSVQPLPAPAMLQAKL